MRKVTLIFLTIALSSCSTTSVMNGIMTSWEGQALDTVVSQWGYPNEQREFNGNRLYVWNYNKSVKLPTSTTTKGTVNTNGQFNATSISTGGQTFYGGCSRILEVNSSDVVVSWSWKGNNCPFAEAMEYKYWRYHPAS